ncbi:MAG: HAD family phosphatase [Bacillota bacterium]|nr:HAD family phosphatase [Bacillota bacterium]
MKYVIFDFDGTLLDSMTIWDDISVKFLERYGKELTPLLINKLRTLTVRQSAELFKEIFDLSPSVEELTSEIADMAAKEYANNIPLKPFVLDFLEYLSSSKSKMCIATASSRQNVKQVLARFNLQKHFDFIIAAEDIKTGKEQPEIFLECSRRFGAAPSEITVFEDAVHAVKTAKNAGFRVIGVYDKSSEKYRTEIKAICDLYIYNFGELLEGLEGLG